MIMTPSKDVARAPAAERKPYPAWGDLLRQVGQERSPKQTLAPKSRDWRDLVADMIVGRR